jgi:hypothetical protein
MVEHWSVLRDGPAGTAVACVVHVDSTVAAGRGHDKQRIAENGDGLSSLAQSLAGGFEPIAG